MSFEKARHEREETRVKVTIAGETSVRRNWSPKAFAKFLIERRDGKMSTESREIWMKEAEAKCQTSR